MSVRGAPHRLRDEPGTADEDHPVRDEEGGRRERLGDGGVYFDSSRLRGGRVGLRPRRGENFGWVEGSV